MGVSFLSETEMECCVPLWREDAHEMGVSFLSEMEMERCVPLYREDAHDMGVSFEKKRCIPMCGVKVPILFSSM
jgi:hypothetical protein